MVVFVSTSQSQFFTSFHVLQTNAEEDHVTIFTSNIVCSLGEVKSSREVKLPETNIPIYITNFVLAVAFQIYWPIELCYLEM